jgi:hypothetical protein
LTWQCADEVSEGNEILASGQELAEVCRNLEIAESSWLVPRWGAKTSSEGLRGAVLEPVVGTGTIYGVSLPSPPQAIERLSWQISAPLGE